MNRQPVHGKWMWGVTTLSVAPGATITILIKLRLTTPFFFGSDAR